MVGGLMDASWPPLMLAIAAIGLAASILALLTVTFGFVRAAMTFADRQSLARGREMSLQRAMIIDSAGKGTSERTPTASSRS
jgi:hypothetical protein